MEERSIRALRRTFAALPAGTPDDLIGTYEGEFVGPLWLRAPARPGLALLGMPGWWGKRFTDGGDGTLRGENVVRRGGELRGSLAMTGALEPSGLDGRPALVTTYTAPVWRHVVDEFRPLERGTLLGMSYVDLPGLRRQPLPFLLHRR